MKVHAKCHNYAGCLLAYRGDEIELEEGAPMVCPECGKPVSAVKSAGGAVGKSLPLVIGIVLIGAAAFFGAPLISKMLQGDKPAETKTAEKPATTKTTQSTAPSTQAPTTTT